MVIKTLINKFLIKKKNKKYNLHTKKVGKEDLSQV